jgi:hypothetical protein
MCWQRCRVGGRHLRKLLRLPLSFGVARRYWLVLLPVQESINWGEGGHQADNAMSVNDQSRHEQHRRPHVAPVEPFADA